MKFLRPGVLVAEHSSLYRRLWEDLLEAHGLSGFVAVSAREGRLLLEQNTISVLCGLVDLGLPDNGALELARLFVPTTL